MSWPVILLGVLGVVIVGLVAGIVVVKLQGNNEEIVVSVEDEGDREDEETQNSLLDVVNIAKDEVDSLGVPSVEDVVAIYQKYIDEAESSEKKIGLLDSRIYTIQNLDQSNEYSALVISDAVAIDDIEMSISSALQVVNIANIYGDLDLAAEYKEKAAEREEKEGDKNEVWETRG